MSRSLPSLIALRVFEAAGRLESFSKAAVELHVTQGAVSRQVRVLEDELGVKLFTRLTRQVQLTNVARIYLAEVQGALDRVKSATLRIRSEDARPILTISVLPSVGSLWLMPRLARFSQQYPEFDTRMVSSISPADVASGEADVAIRVGALPGKAYPPAMARVTLTMTQNWDGVLAEELGPDVLVPMRAASFASTSRIAGAEDICRQPLIHTASRPHAWPDWMKAQGLPCPGGARQNEFGHFFMSLEAARQGMGVALVPDILMQSPVTQGLEALTTYRVRSAAEYYLLCLRDRAHERPICLFRRWLRKEFRSHEASLAQE